VVCALSLLNRAFETFSRHVLILRLAISLPRVRLLNGKSLSKVTFLPYQTPACRTQHHALAWSVRLAGGKAHNKSLPTVNNALQSPSGVDHDYKKSSIGFTDLAELFDFLSDLVKGDQTLTRGFIDQYLRFCSVEDFFRAPSVSKEFITAGLSVIQEAREIAMASSALVIADSSYLINKAFVWAAAQKGIPSWIYNPDGMWMRVSPLVDESFRRTDLTSVRAEIASNPALLGKAESYVNRRLGWELESGPVIDKVRVIPSLPARLKGKKIFCLHAFRDASNLPIGSQDSKGQATFRSFFEWADAAFNIIAESPDEWAIRAHPDAHSYLGDGEILSKLLEKYGLSTIARAEDVSTLTIVANRLPVYTMSGTIALETVLFGYKANVCATRFPMELIEFAASIEDFRFSLMKDFEEARPKIEVEDGRRIASYLLLDYHEQPQPVFSPILGQPSRQSPIKFQIDLLRQEFSLVKSGLFGTGFNDLLFQSRQLSMTI
jgi:hypothetical protein